MTEPGSTDRTGLTDSRPQWGKANEGLEGSGAGGQRRLAVSCLVGVDDALARGLVELA